MPDIWYDVDTALSEVPVNIFPLTDDTDFKSIKGAVAYNAAGMTLRWHFVTSAGAYTVTSVTPTTGGNYDWTDQGDSGIYTIEIPASGGASINNDTEGYGWFTGVATGVLPWRGPVCGFRAAALNDALTDGGDNLDVNVTQFGGTNATTSGGRPEVNTSHIAGSAVSTSSAQLGVNVVNAAGTAWGSGAITAASIASDAITAAKIADNAIDAGSIATGAITSAKFAAGAIDAAAIANGAIDAATFAADVDAEILSYIVDDATRIDASALNTATGTTIPAILTDTAEIGAAGAGLTVLATAANLSTVAGYLDTEIAAILADTNELQTDWADGGRLDLILDARASQASVDTVDTVVNAVKAKTDSLAFTVAGQVDANIQYVNDAAVTGNGQTGTEWGPA